MSGAPKEVASFRLPDLVAALRKRADENDETVSDLMRRGCLMVLGICPTCERPVPDGQEAGTA